MMGVILLDIGHVLVDVDFMPFCRAVSREGDQGAAAIRARYCQGELKDRHDCGWIGPREYLGMIAADPLTLDLPLDRLRLAWQNIFTPTPGSVEAVEALRRHHELWIMSDTDPLHFAFLLDRFPVLRNMDRYFLSYEHGWLKRSPQAFRHVLDSSGLDASELLLLDDREVNIRSCAKAGIESILFQNWNETLESPELAAFSQRFAKKEVHR
jgi:HAD superfamily hydrolase (TIGR01509 family)